MLKILIVDDQPAVRTALETLFALHGLESAAVSSPADALHLLASEDIGVVVQDMNFTGAETSGDEGVALFRAIRALDPEMPVLLMTAFSSLERAVALIKEGASDYIAKPWSNDKLLLSVKTLIDLRALRQENTRLRAQGIRARRTLAARADLREVVYASPQMHEVVRLAVTIAPSDAPVLITGPNGSGKEKIAEIIQANSRRKAEPFVKVNAGALPENLFEAELFGAEVGAFTGATRLRVGRFEAADGGTLFLDELGTLPLVAQAKLLRVLQTGEYERLGSSATRRANVRLVSATNTDLQRAISAGQFREDLFFRINVIELHVPPLADRIEDVAPLAAHFLATQAGREGRAGLRLSDEALAALANHDWPGNVRELQNRIQRAVLVQPGDAITAADLGFGPGPGDSGRRAGPVAPGLAPPAPPEASARPARDAGGEAERASIEDALERAGGVVARAAAEMGLSRQALYRRMERLGLVLERRLR
jgi:DNA-binding NtrC family response regulator